jgi:uncharacterized protein (TIGR04255 family)
MPEHEIFPNPTVKQVACEVRFPNLFFIESKIGDFQMRVMKDFPLSELVHRRNLMFVTGNAENIQELAKQQEPSVDKIWQFRSASGTTLQISSSNLVLTSPKHNSYHQGGELSFRGIVSRVVGQFFELVNIPMALRIGLRYINECPIFQRSTERFNECYNSILPLNRFSLERVVNMDCAVVANTEQCQIRHMESLRLSEQNDVLLLDLDASMENVPAETVMTGIDVLHEAISTEFKDTIKEPIFQFMRKPIGGAV